MKYLLANFLSIVCVITAAFLAYEGVNYWGWFLLVGVLAGHNFSDCDCSKKEK